MLLRMTFALEFLNHHLHRTLDIVTVIWAGTLLMSIIPLVPGHALELNHTIKLWLVSFHIASFVLIVSLHLLRWRLRYNHLRYWDRLDVPSDFRKTIETWHTIGVPVEPNDYLPSASHTFANSESLMETVSKMNHEGFADTTWGMSYEDYLKRNKALSNVNPLCFLLVADPVAGELSTVRCNC